MPIIWKFVSRGGYYTFLARTDLFHFHYHWIIWVYRVGESKILLVCYNDKKMGMVSFVSFSITLIHLGLFTYRWNGCTGFPALHRDARDYCFACQHTCAIYGWRCCMFWFWYLDPAIKCLWDYMVLKSMVWYCQGDKARVIQTMLFMSGINTLLQTLIGTRLPTVMGVSFAYVLPVLSIIRDYNDGQFDSEKQVKSSVYTATLRIYHFLVYLLDICHFSDRDFDILWEPYKDH